MKPKFLSLIIAAVMILGIIPLGAIPAFAEVGPAVVTTESELLDAMDAEHFEIQLGADIELKSTLSLWYSFTLDLAGYTISTDEAFGNLDVIGYPGGGVTVTFTDSSEEQTGKITSSHEGDSIFWLEGSTATVIFENITIESNGSLNNASVYSCDASLVFKNCSIDSIQIDSSDGTFVEIDEETTVGKWEISVRTVFTIDPTEFNGFDSNIMEAVWDEGTGLWTVEYNKNDTPVAWSDDDNDGEIDEGEATYHTLYDALNTSGSVKLVDDYEAYIEEDIKIGYDDFVEVTLDLNGKTLIGDTEYLLDIYDASVTVKDSSPEKTGCIENKNSNAILAYLNNDDSVLLIEGGTWISSDDGIYADSGICTITGGIFKSTDCDVELFDATVQISGGSFTQDITDYLSEGATATYNDNTKMWDVTLAEVLIRFSNLSLGRDLSVNYYVRINESALEELYESFSMKFTMNGKTTVVTDYTIEDGHYVFTFAGIAPQQMTDNISAEFLIGEEVYAAREEYTIRDYLNGLIKKYSNSEALIQLIADLLTYGAAAQEYKDYNLDDLANGDLYLTTSEALPTETVKSVTGSLSQNVYFTAATVWFDTVNKIGVKLSTAENVTLRVNGEEVLLDGTTYYTNGILATEFDDIYTFELYESGTLVQTLTYSVNSYVYSMMDKNENGELTEMANLARALYRYGLSAGKVAELPVPEAVEITYENATGYSYDDLTATYDAELGWTPILDSVSLYDFFTIDLYAGDTVYFELNGSPREVGLYDFGTWECVVNDEFDSSVTNGGSFVIEVDGTYTFYTDAEGTVKAWLVRLNGDEADDGWDDSFIYIPDGEITDENERLTESQYLTGGSYDSENGWSSIEFEADDSQFYGYFVIQLNRGDRLYYQFSEAVSFVAIYSDELSRGDFVGEAGGERTVTDGVLEAIETGTYEFYTETPNVFVRVMFEGVSYSEEPEEDIDEIIITDNVEIPEDIDEITDEHEYIFIDADIPAASYDSQVGWTPTEVSLPDTEDTAYFFFETMLPAGQELYLEFSEETQYLIANSTHEMPDAGTAKTVKVIGDGDPFMIVVLGNVTMRAYMDLSKYTFEEITDENTQAAYEGDETATYDPELGWTPVLGTQYQYYSFVIDLQKGDIVRYELFGDADDVVLYSFNLEAVAKDIGANMLTISESGTYWFSTDTNVNVKAWVYRASI